LARIDVQARERHAAHAAVDGLQGSAEPAADIEHALSGAQVGHLQKDLVQPRLRLAELRALAARGLRAVPVAQMHRASGLTAAEAFEQGVEIRRHAQRSSHPQQYVAALARARAMKLQ